MDAIQRNRDSRQSEERLLRKTWGENSQNFASNHELEPCRIDPDSDLAARTKKGDELFHTAKGDMVFQKEGTKMNQIAHGGWLEDGSVRERVRTEIVSLLDGTHRLQCKAYMVRHAGDSFFEEEVRLHKPRSGPYQRYLDEIKKRLGS